MPQTTFRAVAMLNLVVTKANPFVHICDLNNYAANYYSSGRYAKPGRN